MAGNTSFTEMSLPRMEEQGDIFIDGSGQCISFPVWDPYWGKWYRPVLENLNWLPLIRQCFQLVGLCNIFTAICFFLNVLYAFNSEILRSNYAGKVY